MLLEQLQGFSVANPLRNVRLGVWAIPFGGVSLLYFRRTLNPVSAIGGIGTDRRAAGIRPRDPPARRADLRARRCGRGAGVRQHRLSGRADQPHLQRGKAGRGLQLRRPHPGNAGADGLLC
ncbi:hypothetical protein G6F68_016966 [Rhizopus microsporus]|nr:hypothetical protein G6F68_016966 [Rhizopus microsporus]